MQILEPEAGFEPARHRVIRITKPMESTTVPFRLFNFRTSFFPFFHFYCGILPCLLMNGN